MQLSHLVSELGLLRLTLMLKRWKVSQLLIKYRQTRFKQQEINWVLRYTNAFILFRRKENILNSEHNLSIYVFRKRMTKLTVIITEGYQFYQLQNKFYPTFFSQGQLHT